MATFQSETFNTDNIQAIQNYYMANKTGFYERLFEKPNYDSFMDVTVKDKLLLMSADAEEGLQGYQKGHHGKGSVQFKGRTLQMRDVKNDFHMETRKFSTENYFAYLVQSGNNPQTLPYQDYIITLILRAIYDRVETSVKWNGRKKDVIPGAPNNAKDTADGFKKILWDSAAAGDVRVVPSGVFTAANAYDNFIDWVETCLDRPVQEMEPMVVYCSLQFKRYIRKSYRDSYGSNTHAQDIFGNLTLPDAPNIKLKVQAGLTGASLCMSRPNTLVVGMDGAPYIHLRYESRQLFVEIDWKYGFEHAPTTELYINEWL